MKYIIFLFLLIFFSDVAVAQSINADKNTVSAPGSNVVEISAVAIPFADKDKYQVVNENYHRAITVGTDSVMHQRTIEISAVAQKPGDITSQTQKREVTVVSSSSIEHPIKNQRTVEITTSAIKR